MKIRLLAVLLVALTGSSAHAGYSGELYFSEDDKSRHLEGLDTIQSVAAQCLQDDLNYHWSFYKQYGVSPFYGDRGTFAKNPGSRRSYLRNNTRLTEAQISMYLKKMQPTSCVGLVLKCLGKGFKAAGQEDLWARLKSHTVRNDVSGGALQEGLQRLGWRLVYWNPDVRKNYTWDNWERVNKPTNPQNIWGYHASNWAVVKGTRRYLYNRVDDISSLVNFGNQVPPAIRDVPFFVGVAHAGYHVFPGSYGQIIEGHSTRPLTDRQTLETSPFSPLEDNGGPRGIFRSGLIAVPPGYIDTPVVNSFPADYSPGRIDSGHTAPMRPQYNEDGWDDYYTPRRPSRRRTDPFGFPIFW
jgi:hypothetical protein